MKQLSVNNSIAALLALAAFATALFSPGIFHDGDTYWHIAAGRWMLDNFAVLRIDPFSFTMAGHAWQTHEWLSEAVMALCYVGLGWNGIALLFAAIYALTAGLLVTHLSRHLSGLMLAATAALALCCTMGGLLARPHILALPCLEIWMAGMLRARDEGRAPHWGLLPVMLVWANLHDSFLIGLGLTFIFGLEATFDPKWDRKSALKWGGFLLLGIFAAMITPFGIYTLTFPFSLMGMKELYSIQEWMPLKITLTSPFLVSAGLTLYLLLSRGARIRPLRLMLLIGFAYLSLAHARHQIITAMIAPFLLAEPLRNAMGQPSPVPGALPLKRQLQLWASFAACLIVMAGARFAFPATRHDDRATPETALTHVPENLRHQPVFNSYGFGGYLIFKGIAPFIDGRAELYGEDFLKLYDRICFPNSKMLPRTLNRYHIRWALLEPNLAVTAHFRTLPGWHETYHDKYAVLFIKGDPPK